jgi:hypothetical protein
MQATIDRKTGRVTTRNPTEPTNPLNYLPLAAALAEWILKEERHEND